MASTIRNMFAESRTASFQTGTRSATRKQLTATAPSAIVKGGLGCHKEQMQTKVNKA